MIPIEHLKIIITESGVDYTTAALSVDFIYNIAHIEINNNWMTIKYNGVSCELTDPTSCGCTVCIDEFLYAVSVFANAYIYGVRQPTDYETTEFHLPLVTTF